MKKAIAKESFSFCGTMVNRGDQFYLRKGSLGRKKLCRENSNGTCIGEISPQGIQELFSLVDAR